MRPFFNELILKLPKYLAHSIEEIVIFYFLIVFYEIVLIQVSASKAMQFPIIISSIYFGVKGSFLSWPKEQRCPDKANIWGAGISVYLTTITRVELLLDSFF